MIKTLYVQNVQSHKKSLLEFHPGLNIIIGKSDSGKTALLRALRYIIRNRPTGDSLVSNWGGDMRVSVTTEETRVSRNRGKENTYVLGEAGAGEFSVFRAFGTEVPVEIQKVLDFDEVSLQSQMDAPFLLATTTSPGEVAAHFNKIAHIDKIDVATKKVQRAISRIEDDIKSDTRALEKMEEQLVAYSHIPKMEAEIEVLEDLEKRVSQIKGKHQGLFALLKSIQTVDAQLEEVREVFTVEPLVDSVLANYQRQSEFEEKRIQLNKLLLAITRIDFQITEYTKLISGKESVENLLFLHDQKAKQEKDVYSLHSLIEALKTTENRLQLAKGNIHQLETTFTENMPDICPLCDSVIQHKHD